MDEQEIIRKMKIREKAYIYMGDVEDYDYSELLTFDVQDPIEELEVNLDIANSNKSLDIGYDFKLKQSSTPKVNYFVKRVFNHVFGRCFGFLIFPLISQQNNFNGRVLNSVSLLRQLVSFNANRIDSVEKVYGRDIEKIAKRQEEIIDELNSQNRILKEELEQQKKELVAITDFLKQNAGYN